MSVYQGLFNTTDINADNIYAENAMFNNVTLLGNIKTDLTPLKVVITNFNQELNTITYSVLNIPNSIVYRDSNGDIIVGAITADDLHINNSIDVKKLDIEPNVDGEVFTIYDVLNDKIFTVNTNTKVVEIFGSLIIDDLDVNKLVITDGNKKLISTLTLPDNCIINDPTMVFTGNNNSVLMTNGSGQVYCSTTLPSNIFMSDATLTNPYISSPFIGYGVGQANRLLRTGVSGNTITSLTLPDNCDSTNQSLTTPTINGISSSLIPTSTYDLGSSSNKWVNVYATNTNTNTLIANSVGSSLIPDVDITRSLGSSSYRWNQLYTKNLTDNNNTVSIFGVNDNNKFNIYYKDPSNNDATFINIRTSLGGRISIVGDPSQNKFNISDGTYNIFNVNTAQNGRITIGGANTQAKLNILDVDNNSVFNVNTGNNGRISIGGLDTGNKFTVSNSLNTQVFRIDTTSTTSSVIVQGLFRPWTSGIYDIGSNSFKWNNVYANNFIGSWTPSGDLIPSANNTYDLGSSSYRWNNVYANNINTNGLTINNNAASLIDPALNSTTTFLIGSGTSTSGSSTYSQSVLTQGIKGLGGGNVYYYQTLSYYSSHYVMRITGSMEFMLFATHLVPDNNMTYDLGGPGGVASIYWRNLYVQQIIGPGSVIFSSDIRPSTNSSSGYNCGTSSNRWANIYAVNGIIQTSDGNDKENICECELGLDFVNDLKPKKYNWIGKSKDEVNYGIVAQDLESTLEKHNCCNFSGLQKPVDDVDKYGINYSQLIPILIKSIQELSSEVERLKNLIK